MKKPTIWLLKTYHLLHPLIHQLNISVFGFSSTCRQSPSCTEYTVSQIQNHGTITGLKRGLTRVLQCHSF